MNQNWHARSANQVCAQFGVDPKLGLATVEASRRREKDGPNELPDAPCRPIWKVFVAQFASPLIYILGVAAAFAFFLDHRGDALVILVVVLLNSIIGAVQEGRAERSMEALRKLSSLKTRVLRDGQRVEIEARDLVCGDLVLLAAGDAVLADGRLLEAATLETSEAALTGESLPTEKSVDDLPEGTVLPDRRNMVYSGTYVAAGRALAIVVATGLSTEVGKIARLTATAEDSRTPLELRLAQFSRYLVLAAIFMFMIVVAIGFVRGLPFLEVFMVAISQMVSMVPEGLPVAMTIALAVGMQRMARRRTIVRRLSAVETLGSTSVVCTDKTGTLTKNEMTVTRIWLPGGCRGKIEGVGYEPSGSFLLDGKVVDPGSAPALRRLVEAVVLCNDARVAAPDDSDPNWRALGDPTEAALITLGRKAGIDPEVLVEQYPREGEIPFDATTKIMATCHRDPATGSRIFIKGAPEEVLALCGSELRSDGEAAFDHSRLHDAECAASEMADDGLRLLAVAMLTSRSLDERQGMEALRGQAMFLGLVGQMDPPREQVRAAVAKCRRAGIRPVMVTGDHRATGLAIARKLGIASDQDIAVNGTELEQMTDQQLRENLWSHFGICARPAGTEAAHRSRISGSGNHGRDDRRRCE